VEREHAGVVARPLRIELAGGRYHVTARGNERRDIFRDDRDRQRFIELLAALPERFGVRLHAYVLMPNHYHLLLETPEANLSRTIQWLNVSYCIWFNRRHRRSGHLLQGRFGAVIVEDEPGFQEVGRYVHLNPVRVAALGLDKGQRAVDRIGLTKAPCAEVLAERLRMLREWRWSSYPAYAGYVSAPGWLTCEVLGRLCGGRTVQERRAALRGYSEQAVRQGLPERPWERLIGGVVLGTQAFAQRLGKGLKSGLREHPGASKLRRGLDWKKIVEAVEEAKGERWERFVDRHGDWGRDAALWLGRRLGRLSLGQLAALAGGLDYATVGAAVSRFARRLARDASLAKALRGIEDNLSNV
jgi:REP element-mobilizing transposase RayT